MQEIIEKTQKNEVSIVSNEGMKLLFRAVTGKKNSLTEIFHDDVMIKIDDIIKLNTKLEEKLGINHQVTDFSFSATLNFSEGRSRGIASFGDLERFDTEIEDTTESAIFRWDYNIQFPGEEEVKPHSILLRVSSPASPMLFLQRMLATDPEEMDSRQKEHASIMCVINFSNAVLSQELMNIVSKWVKTRSKHESVFPILEKHRYKVYSAAKWLKSIGPNIFIIILLLFANLASQLNDGAAISKGDFLYLFNFIFIGFAGYKVINYFGNWIHETFGSYYQMASRFSVIGITAGDMARQSKSYTLATKAMYKTSGSLIASLLLNILGGVVAAYICIEYGITGE